MSQASPSGSTSVPAQEIVYNGQTIHQRDEMLSLTDMWNAAGADYSRRPAPWIRSKDAKRFIEFLAETAMVRNSHHELFQVVRGGNNPSTWAHWQIGLAYAKYLSPEFHVWCNTVIRERMQQLRGQPAPGFGTQISPQDLQAELSRQIAIILRDTLSAAVAASQPALPAPLYVPMLQLLIERGVKCKKRGLLSKRCATHFVKWLTANGRTADFKLSTETKRFLFNPDAADAWFEDEGDRLVSDHEAMNVEMAKIDLTKYKFLWEGKAMKEQFGPMFPSLQHRAIRH